MWSICCIHFPVLLSRLLHFCPSAQTYGSDVVVVVVAEGWGMVLCFVKVGSLTCQLYSTDTQKNFFPGKNQYIIFLYPFSNFSWSEGGGIELAIPESAVKCLTTKPSPLTKAVTFLSIICLYHFSQPNMCIYYTIYFNCKT